MSFFSLLEDHTLCVQRGLDILVFCFSRLNRIELRPRREIVLIRTCLYMIIYECFKWYCRMFGELFHCFLNSLTHPLCEGLALFQ